jgi:muramidase (phage lysozyme)
VAATSILQVAKAAVTLPNHNNQPRSVALEVEPIIPECVLPRTEGEINLTEQVHQKLLKDYFNTGEAVDHSIMAPPQSRVSCQRMKLQGLRSTAKSKYNILNEFYYSAMQQISDKCDAPPCQHLIN